MTAYLSSLRQTRPAAERDRHAAAPQSGQADAPPRGLHSHLHRLCKLQPQAHRRGHLPAARRAQEAHRVSRVSGWKRLLCPEDVGWILVLS